MAIHALSNYSAMVCFSLTLAPIHGPPLPGESASVGPIWDFQEQESPLRLCCTPSPCILHHRPVLCTMVHKGDLFFKVGVTPNIFHFLLVHMEHVETDTFCPYLMGHKDRQQTLCSAHGTPTWCTKHIPIGI